MRANETRDRHRPQRVEEESLIEVEESIASSSGLVGRRARGHRDWETTSASTRRRTRSAWAATSMGEAMDTHKARGQPEVNKLEHTVLDGTIMQVRRRPISHLSSSSFRPRTTSTGSRRSSSRARCESWRTPCRSCRLWLRKHVAIGAHRPLRFGERHPRGRKSGSGNMACRA